MKRYIAFNGSANSGVQTHDKAVDWAKKEMQNKTGLFSVHLCEVVEVVERVQPTVTIKAFTVAAEATDIAEAA